MSCDSDACCRYIVSRHGILKLIELLCDVLAVILGAAAPTVDGGSGHKGFFLFVTILSLIITLVVLIKCLINLQSALFCAPWWLVEFIWCVFIALFYFIASIVIATIANQSGVYGGAAFFGFAAFIAYVAEAILHWMEQGKSRDDIDRHQQQYAPSVPAPMNRHEPGY